VPKSAELTPDRMQRGLDLLCKRLEAVQAFDPEEVEDQHDIPHVKKLSASIVDALERTFGAGTIEYDRYSPASRFNNGPFNYAYKVDIRDVHRSLQRSKDTSIALLEQAIESLRERLAEVPQAVSVPQAREQTRKVFVVHGHDDAARETVARYLDRIGFEPVILHEQASGGRTIVEKIEANSEVSFAVVLLTPDDEGSVRGGETSPRARQNVILELGYFLGKLGRRNVCALTKGVIEIPSDFSGVVYVPLDDAGAWKSTLGRELQEAGHEIDWNLVMR